MPAYKRNSNKKITYTKGELFEISKCPLSQQVPKCFQSNHLNDIPLRRGKNCSNYNYKPTFAPRRNIDELGGKRDFTDNFSENFNHDTFDKGQKFVKNSFNQNKPFKYEHDNLYQNKSQKNYCKPASFSRDFDKRRFEPNMYSNSKSYKSSEPEWFSEGPYSHLDKMELKGFEDSQNSPENDSQDFEKNLFKQNQKENDKSQNNEVASKNVTVVEPVSHLQSLPEELIDQIQLDDNQFEKQPSPTERKESRFHALFENKVQSTSSSNISDAFKSLVCGTAPLPPITETTSMTPFEKLVLAVKKQEANPKALNFASQPEDAITEEDILRDMQTSSQCNTNSYGLFTTNFTTNANQNSYNEFNKAYPESAMKEPINEATFNMLSMIASSANMPWPGNLGKFNTDPTKNVVNHFYSNVGPQHPKTAYQEVGEFLGAANKGQNNYYPAPPTNVPNVMLPPVPPGSGPWFDQTSQNYHRLKLLAIAAAAATINNQAPPVNPMSMFLNAPIPCQPTLVPSQGSYSYGDNHPQNVPKPYNGNYNKMNSHVQEDRRLNLMEKATSLTPTAVFRQLVSSTLLPTKTDENLKFKDSSKSQANPNLEYASHTSFGNNPEVIPSSYKSIPKSDIMNFDNDAQQRQHMLMNLSKYNDLPNLLNYRSPNFGVQPNMSSQNLLMLQHQYTMLLNLLNTSNNLAPNQKIILQNYFYQLNSAIMGAGLQQYFMANPCLIPSLSASYFQNLLNPPNNLQPYVPATSTQNLQSQNKTDEE